MNEQRCPMCGKQNTAELDICSFCGARLKPLRPDPPESQPPDSEHASDEGSSAPDWLTSLREGQEHDEPTDDLPDWLRPRESETSLPWEPDESLPDWLASLREEDPVGEISGEPESEEGDTDALGGPGPNDEEEPDWLQRLRSRKQAEETFQANDDSEPEAPDELPDWLTSGAKTFPSPDETILSGTSAGELASEARSDWMSAAPESQTSPDRPSETISPFPQDEEERVDFGSLYEEELPDWLSEASPKEETGKGLPVADDLSFASGGMESQLEPADLPTWLEAMRPVESVASDLPSEEGPLEVESAGPLSGLRGVLPAEAEISQVAKPPHYSAKLHLSETHTTNAALLTEMLKAEGEGHPALRREKAGSPALLRIGIALLLTAAVVWALLTGAPGSSRPATPAEVSVANALVEGLSPNAPVLVAVDYEPALAGEMEAAASSLVDHLMRRGAHLALISTTPSGPATAERLIASRLRSGSREEETPPYTNLGFLPGGAAGLQSFAQAPQQALPFVLDPRQSDVRAWDGGPLGGVQTLSDFALAVVVTEDADRARAWIEQVGPALDDAPLVMVVSAQAEPIVRSYYYAEPRQVDGLLAGLVAGAAYEDLNERPGLAVAAWNAFSVGLLATAGLVLIGGLMNLLLNAFSGRGRQRGREERS